MGLILVTAGTIQLHDQFYNGFTSAIMIVACLGTSVLILKDLQGYFRKNKPVA